jgi:RNA ligase
MLQVQEYLLTHSFADLVRDHGVYASFSKNGEKFSLNYDQIESKPEDTLSQECRGLILAFGDGKDRLAQAVVVNGKLSHDAIVPGPTQIVAFPMRRFFNHGQGSAAEIDWNDPKLQILEKLDGTLCIVYYDPFHAAWHVATRSVPEADVPLDNGIFTFRSLFEKAMAETTGGLSWFDFTMKLDIRYTYCFELTTPYNRIVVEYPKCGITLLAIRELATLAELELNESHSQVAKLVGVVPLVQAYHYASLDELIAWVSTVNPMEHEGCVIRVGEARQKVKSPAYMAYNRIRDTVSSERGIMEVILCEKDDDVLPMLPEEIANNMVKLKHGIQVAIQVYDASYAAYRTAAEMVKPGDKKTFAIMLTQNKSLWHAPFFQMYDGKATSMRDFINQNRKEGEWGNSFLDKMLEVAKK